MILNFLLGIHSAIFVLSLFTYLWTKAAYPAFIRIKMFMYQKLGFLSLLVLLYRLGL